MISLPHNAAGHTAEVRRTLAELERKARRGEHVAASDPAVILIGLNEKDKALVWLERLVDQPGTRVWLQSDFLFDPLRGEPRFKRLLRDLGFT